MALASYVVLLVGLWNRRKHYRRCQSQTSTHFLSVLVTHRVWVINGTTPAFIFGHKLFYSTHIVIAVSFARLSQLLMAKSLSKVLVVIEEIWLSLAPVFIEGLARLAACVLRGRF